MKQNRNYDETEEIQYKAIVRDRETKKLRVLSLTACSLKHALHEIRANGFSVNNYKCKPAEVFDYIMEHTNASPWDWEKIKSVPKD